MFDIWINFFDWINGNVESNFEEYLRGISRETLSSRLFTQFEVGLHIRERIRKGKREQNEKTIK